MKKMILVGVLSVLMLSMTACVAGPNEMKGTQNEEGDVAGFWRGLWHGFITPFTFLVSLFNQNINIYEVHNNGAWYNFGFMVGASMILGGSGSGGGKVYSDRRK